MFKMNNDVEDVWVVLNMDTMEVVSDKIPMTEARDLVLEKARTEAGTKFGTFACDGEYTYKAACEVLELKDE